MRRVTLGLLVSLAAVVFTAAPAAGHAELRATEPESGAVLAQPPPAVKLVFTESVDVSLGTVEVFDGDGDRVATGPPAQAHGRDTVAVALPDMGNGAYVVTWRVTSTDSHPIRGAFTFIVGAGTTAAADPQALVRGLGDADRGNTGVGIIFGLVRFASYASLVVLIGGAAFLLALWPGGRSARPARRLIGGAWVLSILLTVAGIAMQGVYAGGLPLGDVFRWSVIDGVLGTKFGRAWLARLILLALAGPLLLRAMRRDRPVKVALVLVLAAIGAAVLSTGGIAGHPGTDSPAAFTVGLDTAHFAAVCLWLGGLVLLCLVVLRRDAANVAGEVVTRFSKLAVASVAVIVLTGTVQGWWQVRSLGGVTDTTYGRLLITKVVLFSGMVGLGALGRAWVKRRQAVPAPALVAAGPGAMTASTPEIGRLRRSVAGEAVIAVAVLAVTAVLVNTVPARTAVNATDSVKARDAFAGPFETQLHTAKVRVDVGVDPAAVGPNEIHIFTLTHGGKATDVEEVKARITLAARNIGPLELPLQRVGPGHLAAYEFIIPFPGQWLMEVTARTSDIEESTATTAIEIR